MSDQIVNIIKAVLIVHVSMIAMMMAVVLLHYLYFKEDFNKMRSLLVVSFILLMSSLIAVSLFFIIETVIL